MRKSVSSVNLSGIIARKRACSTMLGDMARTLWRTHTSPPSGSFSSSLTVFGERLRKSDWVSTDRDGNTTTHSHTSDKSCSGWTDREMIALLKRAVATATTMGHWMMNERRWGTAQESMTATEQGKPKKRMEGPLYWKLSITATRARDAGYIYDRRAHLNGRG